MMLFCTASICQPTLQDINKPEQLIDDSLNSEFDPESVHQIDFCGKTFNIKYKDDKYANGVYDYYMYSYSVTDTDTDAYEFVLSQTAENSLLRL